MAKTDMNAIDLASVLLPTDVYVRLVAPRPIEWTRLSPADKAIVAKSIASLRTQLDGIEKQLNEKQVTKATKTAAKATTA